MRLEFLRVINFRNLKEIEVTPGKHLNLFLGKNAQGKTSLLESLYFLSFLKSFRTNNILDLLQFEKEHFQVEATVVIPDKGRHFIKIRSGQNDRKLIINEKNMPKRQYMGLLKVIEFSPESLMVIKQGPELRRKLLDDATLVFYPEAATAQESYEKIVKQRNATLRQLKQGEMAPVQGKDILESLFPNFIAAATDVSFLRLQLIENIKDLFTEILSEIQGARVSGVIDYFFEEKLPKIKPNYQAIKGVLEEQIKAQENQQIEISLGRTYAGPHRHLVNFSYDGKNSRFFSSQGQQRALILAFKIAQIVYHKKTLGTYPLLLLDDVLSEFDENKQKYLIEFLQRNEAQTFLTTTNYGDSLNGAKLFYLESGVVRIHGN